MPERYLILRFWADHFNPCFPPTDEIPCSFEPRRPSRPSPACQTVGRRMVRSARPALHACRDGCHRSWSGGRIENLLRLCQETGQPLDLVGEVHFLLDYVREHGERSPVAGWQNLKSFTARHNHSHARNRHSTVCCLVSGRNSVLFPSSTIAQVRAGDGPSNLTHGFFYRRAASLAGHQTR